MQWGLPRGPADADVMASDRQAFAVAYLHTLYGPKVYKARLDVRQPCSPSIGSTRKPHARTSWCDVSQAQLLVLFQVCAVLQCSCFPVLCSSVCAYTTVY